MPNAEENTSDGVAYFIDHLFFALARISKETEERVVRKLGQRQFHTVLPISRVGFQRILHERFPERYDGIHEGTRNGGGQRLSTYCNYFNNGLHKMGYRRVAINVERICEGRRDLITPAQALQRAAEHAGAEYTQEANDLSEPDRVAVTTYRILRDTEKARRVKFMHRFECQICGHTIQLPDGSSYAEAHHIRPLGRPHNGPDEIGNVLCVCPNHHAELDYCVAEISLLTLRRVDGHVINPKYVEYHNRLYGLKKA